jgi:hypothetical protein
MDRPLCPLCKTKHFAREAHEWKNVDVGAVRVRVPVGRPEVAGTETPPSKIDVVGIREVTGKVGRPRIYDDPKVRRREYMREWRKRGKVAKV